MTLVLSLGDMQARIGLPFAQRGGTWLQRMDRITNWLVRVGRWLIDRHTVQGVGFDPNAEEVFPQLDDSIIESLMSAVFTGAQSVKYATESTKRMMNSFATSDLLRLWQHDVTTIYGQQSEYAPFVHACKRFFEWCNSVEVTASRGSTSTTDALVNMEQGVLLTAIGKGAKRSWHETHGMSARLPFVWVTMIEVCDIVLRRLTPTDVPAISDQIELFNRGLLTREELNGYLRYAGAVPDQWIEIARARAEKIDWHRIIEFARRNARDDKWVDEMLLDRGVSEKEQRAFMQELYWEVPSIQDHLHWLSRNVDDADYVQKYGLLDGFAPDGDIRAIPRYANYRTQTDTHGRDFWKTYGHDLHVKGLRYENAAYHYAAHWIQPAPTQMQEFIYRLRSNKPGVQHRFTVEDYKRILTEQDYAPLAREWFAETAFRVPALSYIRDMYRMNVIDDDALVSYHQDLGYTEEDSKRFLGVDKIQKLRMRVQQSAGWTPSALGKAVALSVMPLNDARDAFKALGWTQAEGDDAVKRAQAQLQERIMVRAQSRLVTSTVNTVRQAISVGVMDVPTAAKALQQLGWTAPQAQGIAQLEDTAARTARVKRVVQAIRGMYLHGEVEAAYVTNSLTTIGIVPGMVANYLAEWNLANNPRRKRRTAAQIVNDIVNAGMSIPQARQRLFNLGYPLDDISLFIADAQRQLNTSQGALFAAQQIHGNTAVNRLLALQKTSGGLSKKIIAELQKQVSPSKIKTFVQYGLMGEAEAREMLSLYGWELRAIDLLIEEARYAAAQFEAKATDKQKDAASHFSGGASAPGGLQQGNGGLPTGGK